MAGLVPAMRRQTSAWSLRKAATQRERARAHRYAATMMIEAGLRFSALFRPGDCGFLRSQERQHLLDATIGQSSLASIPRLTPGRAISASYQRPTFGKSANETLWRSCSQAQ